METTSAGPTQESEAYRYLPVDRDTQEIRLFKITSGTPSKISGILENFGVAVAPKYIAVSYEWSPEHPTKCIEIEGKLLSIRQNLFDLFELHAAEYTGQYIWADQICINQNQVSERNHQVQLMELIFQRAEFVITWLGKSDDADIIEETTKFHEPRLNQSMKSLDRAFERALEVLSRNGYWERVWIVQEMKLAENLQYVWGRRILPEWALSSNIQLSTRIRDLTSRWKDPLSGAGRMAWDDLIQAGVFRRCLDPRDKIYAMQSLLDPKLRVRVDYTKSVREVCLDALTTYELYGEGLDYLSRRSFPNLVESMGLLTFGNMRSRKASVAYMMELLDAIPDDILPDERAKRTRECIEASFKKWESLCGHKDCEFDLCVHNSRSPHGIYPP